VAEQSAVSHAHSHMEGGDLSYQEPSGPELLIHHTGQIFPLGTERVNIGRFGDNIIVPPPEVEYFQVSPSSVDAGGGLSAAGSENAGGRLDPGPDHAAGWDDGGATGTFCGAGATPGSVC
jgi:hypothetical protein